MNRQERRARRAQARKRGAIPSGIMPVPKVASPRARELARGLMETLGPDQDDDQATEDRALAAFIVAIGQIARIKSGEQRDKIVSDLTPLASALVAQTLDALGQVQQMKDAAGDDFDEFMEQAMQKGLAVELPNPGPTKSH